MSITVTVEGSDITDEIDPKTLQVVQMLTNQVDTAHFTIWNPDGSITAPAFDDDVVITDGSTTVFAGKVASVERQVYTVGAERITLNCVDHTMELDRLLASRTYEDTTVEDILADLFDSYAPGFTYANASSSFEVTKIAFNQVPLSQCIRKLADIVRYDWYIDEDKDLHFFPATSNPAPFALTDSAGKHVYRSLSVSSDGTQVVNRVRVRGGEYDGDEFTDTITVSGNATKSFNLPYKMANLVIELDTGAGFAAQTVGVDFIDTFDDFDVLYSFQTQSFRFENALADGNKVRFTGNPKTPVLAVIQDAASVALYGPIEKLITDTSLTSNTVARKRAAAELLTYAETIVDARFQTYTAGLRTGMLINITAAGFDESLLIKRVTFTARTPTAFQYDVECISTQRYTLIELLRKIITPEATATDETEIAQTLIPTSEEITIDDEATGTQLNAIANSLISYWKMDGDTVTAKDSAGSNDLQNRASSPYVTGKINDAIDLERSNTESIYCIDSAQTGLDLSGNFTIQAWIKIESLPGSGERQVILAKRDASNSNRAYSLSYYNDTGTKKLQLQISSNGTTEDLYSYTISLSTATWYHVVVTLNLSGSIAVFYVNGSGSGNVTGALTSIYNSGAPVRVGGEEQDDYTADKDASAGSTTTTVSPNSETNDTIFGVLGAGAGSDPGSPTDGASQTRIQSIFSGNRARMTQSIKTAGTPTTSFAWTGSGARVNAAISLVPAVGSSIASGNTGSLTTTSFSSPLSGSFNSGAGSNRILIVSICANVSSGGFTVTYGAQTMRNIYSDINTIGGQSSNTSIYMLINPTTGANTLSVSAGFGTGFEVAVAAVIFTGVSQQTPFRTKGSNTFDGIIDEVGVWGAALSSGQVTSLYNAGSGYPFPFV